MRPGPRSMVKLFLRCVQNCQPPALRYGCAPQVIRRGYGRYSQPTNPRPMRKRQRSLCFASNRSTMGSIIDFRKVHALDTAVESQSGRATNDTRSPFRPKKALNRPFLPMTKRVPVMGNRRGILCRARHRPQEVCVGEIGYLLKSTSMVVTVTMCAPPPEIAGSASPNWAAAAAATAAAQLGLWACPGLHDPAGTSPG